MNSLVINYALCIALSCGLSCFIYKILYSICECTNLTELVVGSTIFENYNKNIDYLIYGFYIAIFFICFLILKKVLPNFEIKDKLKDFQFPVREGNPQILQVLQTLSTFMYFLLYPSKNLTEYPILLFIVLFLIVLANADIYFKIIFKDKKVSPLAIIPLLLLVFGHSYNFGNINIDDYHFGEKFGTYYLAHFQGFKLFQDINLIHGYNDIFSGFVANKVFGEYTVYSFLLAETLIYNLNLILSLFLGFLIFSKNPILITGILVNSFYYFNVYFLIALGFLIDTLLGNATLPDGSANGSFGFTSFAASVPFWIGKIAFGFMLPILAGYIAQSIADRPGLLPGMLGGMIAAQGYTFNSMFENQNMVGDGTAVSGFLGALFAGFAAGIIVNLLKKAFSWLPKAMDGIKPVFLYPLFGTFLVGALMCLINPIIGVLNTTVSNGLSSLGETSQILLSIVLAAMMATDMGGPFNKAAYVFGTAAIADGNTWIMAAVMIGGMVPPIAIALSTTFAKSRWTEEERKNGPVNYLMGLCFITEGAIPYAASDPLRVIPSCMVGSALAGALTALFGVTCPAPHGGIFTFVVCEHPLLYIVALLAGSLAGAVVLTLLKGGKRQKKTSK